ncbi:HypC/HybG/HupF family hydrogenase formation chaperone [Azohydromonas caseinilytica]|uniref:HypC/HybG/HupF family hydrogenase formation chaperone n=1 Tax=Azohydromonas caseinilytica TaxID=2728836 RepID=A0A848FBA9_9BURK|nr:HypC/HybG/HupF family hydrogenase formation chaperone [Azohydromonas caseinilytica]NML15729.1 HypC/HybG/HupF family hydrogenase formation chaperone [Azohydromonas caseinilytica]
MCIGIPMQVVSASARRALVRGRGEQREVDTALVGEVAAGEWLLVFLDAARERIDAQRAAEVNAALDLLAGALGGQPLLADDPGFALPSAMSAREVAALAGLPSPND